MNVYSLCIWTQACINALSFGSELNAARSWPSVLVKNMFSIAGCAWWHIFISSTSCDGRNMLYWSWIFKKLNYKKYNSSEFRFDDVHIFKFFNEGDKVGSSAEFFVETSHVWLVFKYVFELAVFQFKPGNKLLFLKFLYIIALILEVNIKLSHEVNCQLPKMLSNQRIINRHWLLGLLCK